MLITTDICMPSLFISLSVLPLTDVRPSPEQAQLLPSLQQDPRAEEDRTPASMAALLSQQQQRQQEGTIEPFTNEGGEGWLSDRGRQGRLVYTGGVARGKAEGQGTICCKGGGFGKWTIRGAAFRDGAMLPCRAVIAWDASDDGDAFAGPLAASSRPADGARGAVVRGADGGRFEGTWPANGADNDWFTPLCGAAWVRADGSVHAVTLDGRTGIHSGCEGWRPGGAGWMRLGVLTPKGLAREVHSAPRARPAPRGGGMDTVFQPFPTVPNRFQPFLTVFNGFQPPPQPYLSSVGRDAPASDPGRTKSGPARTPFGVPRLPPLAAPAGRATVPTSHPNLIQPCQRIPTQPTEPYPIAGGGWPRLETVFGFGPPRAGAAGAHRTPIAHH
jgi:hypothetical protein